MIILIMREDESRPWGILNYLASENHDLVSGRKSRRDVIDAGLKRVTGWIPHFPSAHFMVIDAQADDCSSIWSNRLVEQVRDPRPAAP